MLIGSRSFGMIELSFSLAPTSSDGSDPNGFVGSTWNFSFATNASVYSDAGALAPEAAGVPVVYTSLNFVTISGAGNTDYNGTFLISDSSTTVFAHTPNNGGGSLGLGFNGSGLFSLFSVGSPPILIANFAVGGIPLAEPAAGDPVAISHFDGALISPFEGFFTIDGESFTAPETTLQAVPEPSAGAALLGAFALIIASSFRRPRQ